MDRTLDDAGFDVSDDPGGRSARWTMAVVGLASTAVIAAAVGAFAVTRGGATEEQTHRAAQASIVTALGRPVKGGPDAVAAVTPWAEKALNGTIGRPAGMAAEDRIPSRILQSYRTAETTLRTESPDCRLPWWLLAGVGKVQSDHAAGGQVDASATTTVRILGPRLDGAVVDGAVVRDTDGGQMDGDLTFDRGVGPMLVVPQTWRGIGRDGNGDGRVDVSNSDDAALAVGTLLCSAGSDLTTSGGLAAGLVRFGDSPDFAQAVLTWAAYYRGAPATTPRASESTAATSAPATSTTGTATPVPTTAAMLGPGYVTQPTTAPASTDPPAAPPVTTRVPTRTTSPSVPRPAAPTQNRPAAPTPTHNRPAAPAPTSPRPAPPVPPVDRPTVPVRPRPPQRPTPPPVDTPAPPPREEPTPADPTPERPAPPEDTFEPVEDPQMPPAGPSGDEDTPVSPRERSDDQGRGRQGQGRSDDDRPGNRGRGRGNGSGYGDGNGNGNGNRGRSHDD